MKPKYCSVEDCVKPHFARDLCSAHYNRLRRSVHFVPWATVGQQCSVDGCDKAYHGRGLCRMHYSQQYGQRKRDDSLELRQGRFTFDPNDGFWDVVDAYRKERFSF